MGGDDVTVNLAKSYFVQASLHSSQAGCDVAFESIERMKIRQGHIVLIRNIGEPEHPSSGSRLMEKTGNIGKFGIDAVKGMGQKVKSRMGVADHPHAEVEAEVKYVAALKTEPPNASVNTFNGLLILPPVRLGGPSIEIPHSSCHTWWYLLVRIHRKLFGWRLGVPQVFWTFVRRFWHPACRPQGHPSQEKQFLS